MTTELAEQRFTVNWEMAEMVREQQKQLIEKVNRHIIAGVHALLKLPLTLHTSFIPPDSGDVLLAEAAVSRSSSFLYGNKKWVWGR